MEHSGSILALLVEGKVVKRQKVVKDQKDLCCGSTSSCPRYLVHIV